MKNFVKLTSIAATLVACLSGTSLAQETTLQAISAFQPSTTFAKPFEDFVARVNEEGKGIIQIKMIGGPEAMPPFEIGNALRNGVVDIANTTAVFHANLVPEGLALSFSNRNMADVRANGGYELMNQLHENAGIHWLGRLIQDISYHIYLSKDPENGDVKGLKLRSVPVYQPFFEALGASPMRTAPGEVYTALERGVIDGYGWPSIGIFDLGWQDKTKARINPGFYQVETGVYFSKKAWDGLSDEQKKFLNDQMLKTEGGASDLAAMAEAEKTKQKEAGIKMIDLDDAAAQDFVAKSQEAAWNSLISTSPENGPKLKELFAK